MDNEITARELVQMYTNPEIYEEMFGPEMCNEVVDEELNGYTDGSMLNPRGHHWAIGGIGIWWPNREEPTEQEKKYAHVEKTSKAQCFGAYVIM